MKYDAVALGELLIDFTESGLSPQNNPLFEANPGGAPGNVLAMLAKLGKKTAFIGKVGDDMFGRMLSDTLTAAGIDTSGVVSDDEVNTTLAFVKNADDGDREFSFYRKPGADTMLRAQDIQENLLDSCRVFHFGTLSLTHEPARSATYSAVEKAKSAGALISFDPNLRVPLWKNLDDARRQMEWGCAACDILKIADNEILFLTGETDLALAAAAVQKAYPHISLLLLTKGKDGAECFFGGHHLSRPAFLQQDTVDTTGAGDTFMGCCLAFVLDYGFKGLNGKVLDEMLLFANAAASLVTTKKGAILAMPARADVLALAGTGN